MEPSDAEKRRFGRVAAGALVALVMVVGFFAVGIAGDDDDQFPLVYVDVDELMDTSTCQWTVRVTLRNDSDVEVRITRLETALDGVLIDALPIAYSTLGPGNTAVSTGVWTLPADNGCPERADVAHGNLIVHLEDGTSVSRSF